MRARDRRATIGVRERGPDGETILARIVQARMEQADPALREWFEPAELRRHVTAFLRNEVERLQSDDLARTFARHCPVPGAEPDDFKNRWVEVPSLGEALVGIRFRGLDLERPFVTVVASTRLPADPAEVAAAASALRKAYAQFSPRHVRLFVPPHASLQPSGANHFWEKRILAAPIDTLRNRPVPPGYDRVRLEPSSDTSSYSRYRRAFEELLEDSPAHDEYTRMETEADLAELARAGTLFDVHVDGRWSGLTAVDIGNEEGVAGYRMIEILLARHARGRRLASAVQRHLVESVPDAGMLLLGTIDARNLAAIRAATGLGRRDVGGYYWAET